MKDAPIVKNLKKDSGVSIGNLDDHAGSFWGDFSIPDETDNYNSNGGANGFNIYFLTLQ